MKRSLLGFAIIAFVIAGATQTALAQQQPPTPPQPPAVTNDTAEEVETPQNDTGSQGRSAQFDARLQVAISTVSTLVEIAPNDEARADLQNALSSLRNAQEASDTASLGSEDNQGQQRGNPPEQPRNQGGTGQAENSQRQGPPENRGPSQKGNRPGFVNRMLSGLFG